ncbi:MAG: hypothetical protein M1832_002067 [Thelocarpon impressellum]|nr:MAG: hypothetical protein M1832_002067 [Thelocarpon impressellum]
MAAPSAKISKYSSPDLKNTTDDVLPTYLNSLKFTQSHTLTDVRLLLGFVAVAIAGGTFYFDYTHRWEATKGPTLWAALAYFALNSALTYWIWGVEAGTIFVGSKGNTEIRISSRTEKFSPLYHLTIRTRPSPSSCWTTSEISAPFTAWFDAEGHFVALPFQQFLARNIAVVGAADAGKAGLDAAAEGVGAPSAAVAAAVSGADRPGGEAKAKGGRTQKR